MNMEFLGMEGASPVDLITAGFVNFELYIVL